MTVLEKWIKTTLQSHNVYPDRKLIEAAAEQIVRENEGNSDLYTPDDWYLDTKRNFPELLLGSDIYGPICKHLIEQREDCLDLTGCVPCLFDYKEEMDSVLFKDKFGDENLDNVFNFLLSYYVQKEKEG